MARASEQIVGFARDGESVAVAVVAADAGGLAGAAVSGGTLPLAVVEDARVTTERGVSPQTNVGLPVASRTIPCPYPVSLGQSAGRGGGVQSRSWMSHRTQSASAKQAMLPLGDSKKCMSGCARAPGVPLMAAEISATAAVAVAAARKDPVMPKK